MIHRMACARGVWASGLGIYMDLLGPKSNTSTWAGQVMDDILRHLKTQDAVIRFAN